MPSARPIPTIAPTQSRLARSLAELNITKSQNEHTLENNVRDLAALEEQEIDLRKEVERVEGKREWVEEFRGWVEMLGRFLEEKVCCCEDDITIECLLMLLVPEAGRYRGRLVTPPQRTSGLVSETPDG